MGDFKTIGKFEVIGKIGEGSFGVVYKGTDPFLKRTVAIKVCSVADEDLRQRFAREGQISGNLHHRNIVTVFAFGYEGDLPYLVQEYLAGKDLDAAIKQRASLLPLDKLNILLQVAGGLAYAHEQGIVHRDIKPANIRLLPDGQIKIMDFGIAKLASAETQLTQKGVTLGTASYLPPEQVRGGEVDHRADIFSFGVLAYELMSYERPFRGNTLSALVYQILYKIPVPLSTVWSDCPPELSNLVAKCLEKKVDRRYAAFAEIIPELEAVRDGIAAGRWPALLQPSMTASASQHPGSGEQAVLSQSAIHRTAEQVAQSEGGFEEGDMTVGVTGLSKPRLGGPPLDTDATQPIPILKSSQTTAPPDEPASVEPPAVPPPAVPPPPSSAAAGEVTTGETSPASQETVRIEDAQPLVERGQEIGALVAQGQLEAAMKQLEDTMNRQLDDSSLGLPPLPEEMLKDPATPPRAQTPVTAPAAVPAPPPPVDARTGSYGTLVGPLKIWGKWIAAAVLALAVLGVGGWLLSRDRPAEPEPVVTPPPPPPPPVAIERPKGGAVIQASPWAEVTEITDQDGYVVELPAAPFTPLYLRLSPGTYRISLQHPDDPEALETCELEVGLDLVAVCEASFDHPGATEYFKESGWWR